MKRIIPTILLIFIAMSTAVAQSEPPAPCPPNGVTTDPDNPVNPLHNQNTPDPDNPVVSGNYDFRNWFDWTQSDWPAYFDLGQTSTLRSPYFLNEGAIAHFYSDPDFYPEDGWELVSFHLGLDKENNPDPENIGDAYVILYNKYRSLLRVFVAIEQNEDGNLIEVELQFNPDGYVSGLFGSLDEVQQPLKSFNPAIIASQTQVFDNTINFRNWNYADFPVNYDPCTCEGTVLRGGIITDAGDSELLLNVKIVDEAEINLEGTSQGTLKVDKDPAQTNGTANWDDFYGPVKKIDGAVNAGKKAYKTYAGFRSDLVKEGTNKNAKDGFDNIAGFLTDAAPLLGVVPFASEALAIVDFFVGGSKTNGPVELAPMVMNLEHSFTGNIRSSRPYIVDREIFTPGSEFEPQPISVAANRPLGDSRYPYYNEILGAYTLLEKPKVKIWKGYMTRQYDVRHLGSGFYRQTLEKAVERRAFTVEGQSIKIAVNEASGLTLTEAFVQLNFHLEGSFSGSEDVDVVVRGDNNDGVSLSDRVWVSPMVPLACVNDRLLITDIIREREVPQSSYEIPHWPDFTEETSLSLILVFKNLEGDRFLHKATWSCAIDEADYYSFEPSIVIDSDVNSQFAEKEIFNWFQENEYFEDLNTGFFGAGVDLLFTNQSISNNQRAKETITIESSTIESNAQPPIAGDYITLLAGESIEILPDSEVLPNSDLQVSRLGMNCSAPLTLASAADISNICTGTDYQGQKIMAKKLMDAKAPLNDRATELSFITFPNPADDYLKIALSEKFGHVGEIELNLHDMTGRVLLAGKIVAKSEGHFVLETAHLSSGIYLLQVRAGGLISEKRIIID